MDFLLDVPKLPQLQLADTVPFPANWKAALGTSKRKGITLGIPRAHRKDSEPTGDPLR